MNDAAVTAKMLRRQAVELLSLVVWAVNAPSAEPLSL
jgi:hypothetical protein